MKNKKKLLIIITIICVFVIASIVTTALVLNNKNQKNNSNEPSIIEDNKPIEQNENLDNKNDNSQDNKENNDEKEDSNLDNQGNSKTVDVKKEDEKKNVNTKNNSSSRNNSTNNNNNTQTNTQNTSSNLLPVGKTYSLTNNGGKITILDGNKARLDMFGNSWTTDIKFDGNQYKFAFKKKNGSGSPTYFVNDNVLPILTYTFMKGEENKSTIDAREIIYSKSFSGAMRSEFSGFNWNGTYSCKTNEDIGNDCSLWAQSIVAQIKPGVTYDRAWVLDNNFNILGFVLLQSTDGNIIQLYK